MRWLRLTLIGLALRTTMSSMVDLKASDNTLSSWDTNLFMNVVILNPEGSKLLLRSRVHEILKMWKSFYVKFIKEGEFKKRKAYYKIKRLPVPRGNARPPIPMNFDSSLPQVKRSQVNLKNKIKEELPELNLDISKINNRKYASWFPNRTPGTKITYYNKRNEFNIDDMPPAKNNARPPIPVDFSNSIMHWREKKRKMKGSMVNEISSSKNKVKETKTKIIKSVSSHIKSAPSKIKSEYPVYKPLSQIKRSQKNLKTKAKVLPDLNIGISRIRPSNTIVRLSKTKTSLKNGRPFQTKVTSKSDLNLDISKIRPSNTNVRLSKTKTSLKNGRLFQTTVTSKKIRAAVKKSDDPKRSKYIMKYRKRVSKKRAKRRKKRLRKAKREEKADKEKKDGKSLEQKT